MLVLRLVDKITCKREIFCDYEFICFPVSFTVRLPQGIESTLPVSVQCSLEQATEELLRVKSSIYFFTGKYNFPG